MNARTPKKKSPTSRGSASPGAHANRLRIIGGRWRGVPIKFPDVGDIRPSPDRVRETLFNWLQQDIVGARCLDLFAGSGALGIEALSRGAAHVTFVDAELQIATHLRQTLERLNAPGQTILTMDAMKFLKGSSQPFDVIFLDPPYASDLLERACAQIASGWLAPSAWIYLESPADRSLPTLPQGWSMHRSKRAGQVGYHLAQAIT